MTIRIIILVLVFLFSAPGNNVAFSQPLIKNDSAKTVRKLSKIFPVKTKRDYKRFQKMYSSDVQFGQLINGKDSSGVQKLLGTGMPVDSDLFYLTFQIMDPDFNYALLYKVSFTHFKVAGDDWYLAQFAVLFNSQGKAYKILDHQTRGYNLFDKRKLKSV